MKAFVTFLVPVVIGFLSTVPSIGLAQARPPAIIRDETGTGQYPALYEEDPTAEDMVVYRPADLSKVSSGSLGLYVFGNGGCSADATRSANHLLEVASHGYIAIAPGFIPARHRGRPTLIEGKPGGATQATQLVDAIDWAIAENTRPDSPYFGKIDTRLIAVSGHSCGGLQALMVVQDPRIKTVVIMNSGTGLFKGTIIPSMNLEKAALKALHTPVLYVLGGPDDIAYRNGTADIKYIDHVPAFLVNLPGGNSSSFWRPHGRIGAEVVVQWLDWQLKGDPAAGAWFTGTDCGFCRDTRLTFESKNLP